MKLESVAVVNFGKDLIAYYGYGGVFLEILLHIIVR